jgi:hypothetical protein
VQKRLRDGAIFRLLPLQSSSSIPTILNSCFSPSHLICHKQFTLKQALLTEIGQNYLITLKWNQFSSSHIMRNTYVNFWNYSFFLIPVVFYLYVLFAWRLFAWMAFCSCVHIFHSHTPHPFFFLTSYSGVPSHLMGFHCFIRNYVSSDVNEFILAFEDMCLHQWPW